MESGRLNGIPIPRRLLLAAESFDGRVTCNGAMRLSKNSQIPCRWKSGLRSGFADPLWPSASDRGREAPVIKLKPNAPKVVFAEGDLRLLRVRLDDPDIEGRIFVLMKGSRTLRRYCNIANAERAFSKSGGKS